MMSPEPVRASALRSAVRHHAVRHAADREGVLHDGEADQHHDQHEAAHQAGRHEVVGQRAQHGEARRRDPHQQQEPGRDQHHGPVVAVCRQVDHEDEPDRRHRGQHDARDAGRHRGVVEREADQRRQEQEPAGRDVRIADMPAVEVEIGEQEDEQRRGEAGLGHGARHPVGLAPHREHLLPEAEIDAHVAEHRPGERRRRREDERPAHDEHDGEEEGEQARDADHDALVEGEARQLVLVGVGLPQRDLGQGGGAQLGHVGDGRAGIERQAEHVGVGALFVLGRETLARRDGRDAGGAEVGPDHARAGEAEMRHHDEALELLVGIVGEREDDPVRLRPGLLGPDLDATDDAVGARGGGDLDAVALAVVALDRTGEVDGAAVHRHAHRFDSQRGQRSRPEEGQDKKQQGQQGGGLTHDSGEQPGYDRPASRPMTPRIGR